jgi:hypothetical protein
MRIFYYAQYLAAVVLLWYATNWMVPLAVILIIGAIHFSREQYKNPAYSVDLTLELNLIEIIRLSYPELVLKTEEEIHNFITENVFSNEQLGIDYDRSLYQGEKSLYRNPSYVFTEFRDPNSGMTMVWYEKTRTFVRNVRIFEKIFDVNPKVLPDQHLRTFLDKEAFKILELTPSSLTTRGVAGKAIARIPYGLIVALLFKLNSKDKFSPKQVRKFGQVLKKFLDENFVEYKYEGSLLNYSSEPEPGLQFLWDASEGDLQAASKYLYDEGWAGYAEGVHSFSTKYYSIKVSLNRFQREDVIL